MIFTPRNILIILISSTTSRTADSFGGIDPKKLLCENTKDSLEATAEAMVSGLLETLIPDEAPLVDPIDIAHDGYVVDLSATFSGIAMHPGTFSDDLDLDLDCDDYTLGGTGNIIASNLMFTSQLDAEVTSWWNSRFAYSDSAEIGFKSVRFTIREFKAGVTIFPPNVTSPCLAIEAADLEGFFITSPLPELVESAIEEFIQKSSDPFESIVVDYVHGVLGENGYLCE